MSAPQTIALKNQLTLPKKALEAIGPVSLVEFEVPGHRIVLTPASPGGLEAERNVTASELRASL